jgi:Zn-dependent M28 family amino/carboxypeptidase
MSIPDPESRGDELDCAYDDGFAVAVGLAIAKVLMNNPRHQRHVFCLKPEEVWMGLDEYRPCLKAQIM